MNVTPNPPSQPWTEALRGKLAEHRQEPPTGLWEAIERDLPMGDAQITPRRRTLAVWIAAASVIAALGIMWSLYTLQSDKGLSQQLAEQPTPQAPSAAASSPTQPPPSSSVQTSLLSAVRKLPVRPISAGGTSFATKTAEPQLEEVTISAKGLAATSPELIPEQPEQPQNAADTGNSTEKTSEQSNERANERANERSNDRINERTAGQPSGIQGNSAPHARRHAVHGQHRQPLIALHFRCDGSPLSQAFDSGTFDTDIIGILGNAPDDNKKDEEDPLESQRRAASEQRSCHAPSRKTTTHAEHYMPVRFGAMVEIGITNRIAITTGLNYAHLSSEVTELGHLSARGYDLSLDYLGLPIGVQASLWRRGGLEIVAGGGAALEKCISNRMTHLHSGTANADISTFDDPTRLHPWQWSVQASAGIHYHFSHGIGLYLQPTLNYYFNDGSALPVYYDEHPFCPTLELGLTFRIKN